MPRRSCSSALTRCERHVGELGQRLLEHLDVAGQQRAQHQAGVELAALAQMPDQRRNLGRRRDRGERDGRLLAGLLGDALGMILVQPGARGDEAGERLGELGDQRLPRRRRQIVAHQHRFADRGEMAVARDDAVERERRRSRRRRSRSAPGRPRRMPTSAMAADDRARQVGAARDRRPASAAARSRPHRPDRRPSAAANARAPSSRPPAGRRRARGSPAAATDR